MEFKDITKWLDLEYLLKDNGFDLFYKRNVKPEDNTNQDYMGLWIRRDGALVISADSYDNRVNSVKLSHETTFSKKYINSEESVDIMASRCGGGPVGHAIKTRRYSMEIDLLLHSFNHYVKILEDTDAELHDEWLDFNKHNLHLLNNRILRMLKERCNSNWNYVSKEIENMIVSGFPDDIRRTLGCDRVYSA